MPKGNPNDAEYGSTRTTAVQDRSNTRQYAAEAVRSFGEGLGYALSNLFGERAHFSVRMFER